MSDKTGIHWTDATWNPVTGCSHVSDGCRFCYAEALDKRYHPATFKPWTHANAAENVVLHPERLDVPLRWRKPRRVFVNSMSDLFHETVPDEFIRQVFAVMGEARQHTFQVLTKRPERMRDFMSDLVAEGDFATLTGDTDTPFPWPNVWLGVSVENQRAADERIPLLLQTPAAVRFLSCEPLLGPVDLTRWLVNSPEMAEWCLAHYGASQPLSWIIVGGEGGPHYRPMNLDWARSLRDACDESGVPFFYKQGSGLRPGMNRELDGRLWEDMPTVAAARDREAVMA